LKHYYVTNIRVINRGEFQITYRLPDDAKLFADVRQCVESELLNHKQECADYLLNENVSIR
jgi:hypothetical protein